MRSKDPEKKKELIRFVDSFFETYHRMPNTREIGEHTSMKRTTAYNYLVALRKDGVIEYDGRMIITPKTIYLLTGCTRAGMIREVPPGQMALDKSHITEYVNLPVSLFGEGELYVLRACDDAMKGAGIDPGDTVVVRRQETARDGEIVIAYSEGEGNILRTWRNDPVHHRTVLHPENDQYADTDAKDCRIQGVVVHIIK